MKKRQKKQQTDLVLTYIPIVVVLAAAVIFIALNAGHSILKFYIETGIGSCQKIPIFCMAPRESITDVQINKESLDQFIPYDFPKMSVLIPRGFSVVQERITKVYYKRRWPKQLGSVIYLLYQEPDSFMHLFPQLKEGGIENDYKFIKRIMYAKLGDIKNLEDAFFVILKGIFTPDLGKQTAVTMAEFSLGDKKGFINYNLSDQGNLFDCNVFNDKGDYFKVYIKDKEARLNLEKVFAIISTLRSK